MIGRATLRFKPGRLPEGLSFWHPLALLCTWFGSGLLPKVPGTWGSAAALPFAAAIHWTWGGVGLAIGSAAAAGLSALLLSTSAAAIIGQVVHANDPIAYGTSLLVILTACLVAAAIPASRAAHLDPTQTLRQD